MTWYAGANSTNGGNNTGWVFTAPPGGGTAYSLTCATGSYAVTGQAATFTYASNVNYALACAVGNYTVTGQAATFTYTAGQINYALTFTAGNYAVTGKNATLTYVNKNQIIYGGAGTYKGNLKEEIKEYNEEDDEEMIIMALTHQLIEMRVI